MGVIERGLYVAVGAVDLAAEKVREIPAVEKMREKSLFEQVRDIEPKLRKQADELQNRGEKSVKRSRRRFETVRTDANRWFRSLPKELRTRFARTRKQVESRVTDLRRREPAAKASIKAS